MDIKIIKLPPDRWEEYKALRLEALKNAPTAFASSYEDIITKADDYWQDRLKENQGEKGLLYFAEDQGKLIGMVGAHFNESQRRKHASSIVAMYVSPDFRGEGVGSKLMEQVLEELESRPAIIKIDLDVNAKNLSAINLYQKFGFKIVGTYQKDLYVNGKYYDLYEMEKILEEKL